MQELEARSGSYAVSEAFLRLVCVLLQSGTSSPTLQVPFMIYVSTSVTCQKLHIWCFQQECDQHADQLDNCLVQAYVGFVVGHMLPNHPRWHYATQSQRWRINAAANKIVRLALTTDALPAVPAGAATVSPPQSRPARCHSCERHRGMNTQSCQIAADRQENMP